MIFFMMCMFVCLVWFSCSVACKWNAFSAAESKMCQLKLPMVLSKLLLRGSPCNDSVKKKMCNMPQRNSLQQDVHAFDPEISKRLYTVNSFNRVICLDRRHSMSADISTAALRLITAYRCLTECRIHVTAVNMYYHLC